MLDANCGMLDPWGTLRLAISRQVVSASIIAGKEKQPDDPVQLVQALLCHRMSFPVTSFLLPEKLSKTLATFGMINCNQISRSEHCGFPGPGHSVDFTEFSLDFGFSHGRARARFSEPR